MRLILLVFTLFISQFSFAQHTSFSLYPIKPLLINPAFTGIHGRSEVSLNHRQQWLGIENAPSVSTFQFDRSFTPQVALGVQAQRWTRGAISSNRGNLLFSYKVLLGKSTSLNFGLAGGILSHGLSSQSSYNPADPAIQNLPLGELRPDLSFGTNYRFRGFNLGITFTEMISNRAGQSFPDDQEDAKFYENYIVNFDYKLQLKSLPLAIQPFLLYYQDRALSNYAEGGALLHYNDLVYMGGSYRQESGVGILAGLILKDFQLAYGYEMASAMVNGIGRGSHEIQLNFRFGKMVESPTPNDPPKSDPPIIVDNTVVQSQDTIVSTPTDDEKPTSVKEPTNKAISQVDPGEKESVVEQVTEASEPQHAVYYSGEHNNELAVGFYVIAGAFTDLNNARRNASILSKEGIFAGTGYNSERKVFFVYVYRSDDLNKTREARDRFRKKAMLKDAWLLEIK